MISRPEVKGGLSGDDQNVIVHPFICSFIQDSKGLTLTSAFPPSRKKDLFGQNCTTAHIIFVLRGNKIATHTSCHFSKWLPIKQNDFFVHQRLNSSWNVINLYKSWKQSLSLVSDSDKLRGHWSVMMFDCQPRITYERERERRARRSNGESVPSPASIGPGVFSSPRGGRSLRHYENNWLPSQTCAASVLPLRFCGRHKRSFIFQRLTTSSD